MQKIFKPERVDTIFMDCLFNDRDDVNQLIVVEGIIEAVRFHSGRLESYKAEIKAMLAELPNEFQQSGDRWSFLSACNEKYGQRWSGFHEYMEQLFQLNIGIAKVLSQRPRGCWSASPKSMSYAVIS